MVPLKKLVSSTFALFILITVTTFYITRQQLPEGIYINTRGQPTIGYPKAQVHVVVFEEPKCYSCKEYNNTIFPKIREEFIDTNKILYSVIPVSFLPNSMPAAVALLSVYYSDPIYPNSDLYFTYLDYIYSHQPKENSNWAVPEVLVDFAKKSSPAINLDKLRTAIDNESYRHKVEQNTAYTKEVMGGTISTPTVYVDGIKVETLTYDEVSRIIKQVLQKKGVH